MTLQQLIHSPLIIVLVLAGLVTINWLIGRMKPRVAELLAKLMDNADSTEKIWQLRRWETYMGIGAALVKALIVCVALYVCWTLVMPKTAPIALIGASAFFAILAGSTIGLLLRDVTFGSMMIAERWYNVGDHIIVDPFMNVSGVVEQLTPRSTKLRSLTGEAIWLHNQHIQAVRVTSRGVRTLAIETFVNDPLAGQRMIEQAIKALPVGPTMMAKQLKISETEKLSDHLWRITAVGQTTPGREWLIEDFALKAIKKYDDLNNNEPVVVHGPITRYADATAERRFRRAVRAKA